MEKLNLNEFTENDPKNISGKMMTKGDTVRRLVQVSDKRYFVEERVKNSAFSMLKSYNDSSLAICTEVMLFYKFCIGIGKSYDEKGDVIEEKNYDKDFPFSVEMLIDKCKKEYGIDLSVFPDINEIVSKYYGTDKYDPYGDDGLKAVHRPSNTDKPVYEVWILLQPSHMSEHRAIQINGATGEVISDKIIFPTYPPGPTGGPK